MANTSASSPSVPYRVSVTQSILLKTSAVMLYLIGALLMLTVVGEAATEIINVSGVFLYLVWFWILRIDYTGKNSITKMLTVIGNDTAAFIPFINGVYPALPVLVWRLVSIMKKEDEEEARKKEKMGKADAARRQQQMRALQIRMQRQAANDAEEMEAEAA